MGGPIRATDRTPVLVGVGAVTQREDDPLRAREPVELMQLALERAAEDAHAPALLGRADAIMIPRGFWDYPDPGRLLADRFGASGARTTLAEVGVLQTTLFGRAAEAIASGAADVVLIAGAEARDRAQRALAAGIEVPFARQDPVEPDLTLRPDADILSRVEMGCGFVMPVAQYAMIENALRATRGRSIEAHRREVAELWAGMSRVAATNPDAWTRGPVDVDTIAGTGAANRMLAFPYGKLHTSQWNVDQGAGLVLTSVETARALGIPRSRWVFPLGVADANHMLPLTVRRRLDRSPGFALAARRILARLGRDLGDVRHLELYSCFPAAVQVQMAELGVPAGRSITVTGGMAFAGGPLNSFVLHAIVTMARVLRDDPGSLGLVTAVSGMLTKQGVSVWSSEPAPVPFVFDDVSTECAAATPVVEVVGDAEGPATIVSYTVIHDRGEPRRAVLLCDLPDGRRVLRAVDVETLPADLLQTEQCGRTLRFEGSATRLD